MTATELRHTPVEPLSRQHELSPALNPFPQIADYAFLSDCNTTALVAPSGNVEWLCLSRMDSPSVFGAILDRDAGGIRVGPADAMVPAARRYLPGTMVAETGGRAAVLEAHERLMFDAINGDSTLFATTDGIERLWEVSAPLLDEPPDVVPYAQGSWGLDAVHDVIAPCHWRLPFERRWRESAGERRLKAMR